MNTVIGMASIFFKTKEKTLRKRTLFLFTLLSLCFCGSTLAANDNPNPGQIAGKFHLGTQYRFLGYRVTGYQDIEDVDTNHTLGLFTTYDSINLQLGGGITDNYYLGGNIDLGLDKSGETEFVGRINIFNRYVFDGTMMGIAAIRPFIGAVVGYGYLEISAIDIDNHYLTLGLQGGAHVFVGRFFSIDMMAEAGYEFGAIDYSWFGANDEIPVPDVAPVIIKLTDSGYSHSGYFTAGLGISLWI